MMRSSPIMPVEFDEPIAGPDGKLRSRKARLAPNGEAHGEVLAVKSIAASDIEEEVTGWIWNGWLARGELHLIAGAPSTGKTTITLSAAAIISAGDFWPDGTRAKVGKVLIWSSEDDAARTLKPRLMRMNANLENIRFIIQTTENGKSRPFNPATDMSGLIEHANALGQVDYLILDPMVAALGGKIDSHKNAETRIGLQPVVDFAKATQCAVQGVTHFTKGTAGQDPVERVTGSLAFGAVARIVWATAKGKEGDKKPRIMVRAKSNIGLSGGGFGYDINAAPLYENPDIIATRILWLDAIEGNARDLLDEMEPKGNDYNNRHEIAENFIKNKIKPGMKVPAKEIEEEAEACGIARRTLTRARSAVGVKTSQAQNQWWWTRD